MNKLFVYGIFLDQHNRDAYGMTNPEYDTVPNFITVGSYIAQAVRVDPQAGLCLTGLTVDVDPDKWESLDRLESGYERIEVITTSGEQAYMYAERSTDESR